MSPLLIPARFRGPASSGNGGWTCGALAAHVAATPADAVTVRLRMPPPLDTELDVTEQDGVTVASVDGRPVAEARLADRPLTEVPPVDAGTARAAEPAYPGLRSHPFPTCFACGTGREPGDGLRIFPGPAGDGTAATWTPDPSVAEDWHEYADHDRRASLPVTWAALDCIGGWAGDLTEERPFVLGTMTARVDALPVIGEEHVVVGALRGTDGRKTFTASTLYDSDGRVVATAEHVWIRIDPQDFM